MLLISAGIVVGLLIAKAATALPSDKTTLTKAELDTYLQTVQKATRNSLKAELQGEVDYTVNLFVTVHTILTLVQAAEREFNSNNMITVARFTQEEVQKDNAGNITGGEINDSKTTIDQVSNQKLGEKLLSITLDRDIPNTLHAFLQKMGDLPADFDISDCINLCMLTSKDLGERGKYLVSALQLLRSILDTSDLKQLQDWILKGQSSSPHPINDTANWLHTHLNTNKLDQEIKKLYSVSGNDNEKQALSEIREMLSKSNSFYALIFKRLEDVSVQDNDLKNAINKLSANISPEQQVAWEALLQAIYGAIAWQLGRQAQKAVSEARIILSQAS